MFAPIVLICLLVVLSIVCVVFVPMVLNCLLVVLSAHKRHQALNAWLLARPFLAHCSSAHFLPSLIHFCLFDFFPSVPYLSWLVQIPFFPLDLWYIREVDPLPLVPPAQRPITFGWENTTGGVVSRFPLYISDPFLHYFSGFHIFLRSSFKFYPIRVRSMPVLTIFGTAQHRYLVVITVSEESTPLHPSPRPINPSNSVLTVTYNIQYVGIHASVIAV